ncbi:MULTISPECIES: hypothetical protein [unclassified Thalassospira]|uniref:YaaC family protein n=1 Tax=unclassified Thalassospira TaxID=2648997 RepID=UPI001B0FB872|nr:hypothetical protein [Thalassospira sp.]MBO6772245.1 hypothetical protein [Thalassospira sp.]
MSEVNPRIQILKRDVEQQVFRPLRNHGWSTEFVREHDYHSSLECRARKQQRVFNFAVLYGSATDNDHYLSLSRENERIFFHGQEYQLEVFARNVPVPVGPLEEFFPVLVELNKEIEPDKTPTKQRPRKRRIKRITDENPIGAIFSRLEQFTSVKLCEKLVRRRLEEENVVKDEEVVRAKAEGVAYSMRNALDYYKSTSGNSLNSRILGLYYGTLSFAFCEMLASPNGPESLDDVESMTKSGHGLFTFSSDQHSISDLHVGVLASGFLPQWLNFLGVDTSRFPRKKAKNIGDVSDDTRHMSCTFGHLLGSFPEIDDLYHEVVGGEPSWVLPQFDRLGNTFGLSRSKTRSIGSTYCQIVDYSGKITLERLSAACLPLAEITEIVDGECPPGAKVYRARVDHVGYDIWWEVLPTHSSPSKNNNSLLLPSIAGLSDYRVLALIGLYVLSIAVRYMPSTWRQVEGGKEDEYLAIIKALLGVWERVIPEKFLESIADERVLAAQPGSWM